MRIYSLYIAFFILCSLGVVAQSDKDSFISGLSAKPENITDSLLFQQDNSQINRPRTAAYRLTEKLGDRYTSPMDTMRKNFSNNTLIEGRGLAISYLANIGSPAQSRIFFERNEEDDFIFSNPYSYYITTPANALFYDVKDPYTRLTYTKAGGQKSEEEMFNGVITTNLGKKINVGGDFDYTYVRGQYNSNSNNLLYYRLFGSYLSDKYEMHTYLRNYNYVNNENGGITNDSLITHPDLFALDLDRQTFPVRYTDTWNRIKGGQFFLSHRYNLGFYRELTTKEKVEAEEKRKERERRQQQEKADREKSPNEDPEGLPETENANFQNSTEEDDDFIEETPNAVFVPVSSIIHTLEYEKNSRRFISDHPGIDTCYQNLFGSPDSTLNDFTQSWYLRNTVALSLREGFQDWVKFGLTAYVLFDKRRFTLPDDSVRGTIDYDEFSTYIGAELSKRHGKIFTYTARGELCLAGTDLGEFRAEGELKTQFNIFGKDASIKAIGHIKNLTPAFYTRHHHSRYFWWDNSFKNIQRVYTGGEIDLRQTYTTLSAGVESIQNHIYFGKNGVPEQYTSNLQVITARLKQNFRYKALGWDNEVAYQLSSEKSVLPLPAISAYTNLYLDFNIVKVLNLQLGADVHYHTSYYAPYYEPATQQFQTQDEIKTGNYPLINAYANFKLKQARFFISGYNLGSLFINPKEYFSLPHYPLNPMMIKLGISVNFNN